jgi:hypothetical protein
VTRDWRSRRLDAAVLAGYLLPAVWVTGQLWRSPNGRLLRNEQDHILFEWMFEHAARVVFSGANPYVTQQLNAPDGVNLIANTSITGVAVPMAPVTALFGSGVSVAVLLTLGLAGTAAGWYWLLSRHLVSSRLAAALGGALCGFAPGMVSQAEGHPNLVAQFVVPFLVHHVIVLGRPGRRVRRDGAVLGLLVAYQALVNEEILLFTAIACVFFVVAWAFAHRSEARQRVRQFVTGLAVAAALAGALLAYPLYIQFAGPQHYTGLLHGYQYGTDLGSFVDFARATVAGHRAAPLTSVHFAEESTFFGWPLMLLIVSILVWLRRDSRVWVLTATGVAVAALSLGSPIRFEGRFTTVPGPWALVAHLPLFTSVNPIRLGLAVIPVIGALLAMAVDRAVAVKGALIRTVWVGRWSMAVRPTTLVGVALVAALIPLLPLQLEATEQPPIPPFITQGIWRDYVNPGQSMVTMPLTALPRPEGMRWSAAQDEGFALAGGYFLGPVDGVAGNHAMFGAPPRPTAQLFTDVATSGHEEVVEPAQRAQAAADLAYWRAGVVVLDPLQPNADALRDLGTQLFGPAQFVGGVWVWNA